MLDARLATIRSQLDRLKAVDRKLSAFGASHGHRYNERPAWDSARLERAEGAFGVVLPDELRAFLQAVHGGGAGPGYGFYVDVPEKPCPWVAQPFSYDNRDTDRLLDRRRVEHSALLPFVFRDEHDEDWPPGPGFIPLAHQGCGCFDVLVVSGEQRGRVWWSDSGWCPYENAGQQYTFLDWYERWLDRNLSLAAIEGLKR